MLEKYASSVLKKVWVKYDVLTLKEGDQQLGRLRGVFSCCRATNSVGGAIGTKKKNTSNSMELLSSSSLKMKSLFNVFNERNIFLKMY